jgi:hypothetical protein
VQCEDDHQSPRSLYTIFNDPRGSLIQSLCAHLPSANLREYQFFIFSLLRKRYIERAGEGVQSRLIDHNRPRAVAGPFKKRGWEERAAHLVDTNRQLSGKLRGFIIRLSDIHFFSSSILYIPSYQKKKPFFFLLITFKRFLTFFFNLEKNRRKTSATYNVD